MKRLVANLIPTNGAKLIMPKSSVGSLVEYGALDDLVGSAK